MPTMTCELEGCQKTFTHATQQSTEHALKIHKWRAHHTRLTNAKPQGVAQVRQLKDLEAAKAVLSAMQPVAGSIAGTEADRRSKAWRLAHPAEARRIGNRKPRIHADPNEAPQTIHSKHKAHEKAPVTQTVNFCPCCGCNIQKVAMGMILTQKM